MTRTGGRSMWRAIRGAVVLALLVPAGGCGPSKSGAEPNPDLKVPDIPPAGSRDAPKGGKKK